MPTPTTPAPSRMKLTGAPMVAPGTAATIAATASDAGMSGRMTWVRIPAVPPMKRMGKHRPPEKTRLLAQGEGDHLPQQHGDQQANTEARDVPGLEGQLIAASGGGEGTRPSRAELPGGAPTRPSRCPRCRAGAG
jgi:hypothetical protein